MNDIQIPSGAVVVGVDGSPEATRAVAWAGRRARDEHRPLAILFAVSGVEADRVVGLADGGFDRQQAITDLTASAREIVHEEAERVAHHAPGVETREFVCVREPRQALLDTARQGASTIVVGSRGRGPIMSMLLGSVSATVARYARCPVVVVRPHNPGRARRGVLVGIDGTPDSVEVLEAAFRVASEQSLPVTVLHVLWDSMEATGNPYAATRQPEIVEEAKLAVAESMAGLREKYPDLLVDVRYVSGPPAASLVEESHQMSLLVVGRHDRGALSRVLHGSATMSVVEHATCPVMVIPLDTREAPADV